MNDSNQPFYLQLVDGPDKGRKFELSESSKLIVGRGSASDTKINDPRVSRVHCEVTLESGRATLTAVSSTRQTFVDGNAIERHQLSPGDVFRIGDTMIRLDEGLLSLDQPTLTNRAIDPTATAKPFTPATPPAAQRLVGETFGNYRLDSLVAQGRTGLVFRATDSTNDSQVAVKILLPNVSSSEEQRDRFVRAMRTMLPLKHPNIVRLFHAGKKGKFCWIAMELIDGESMREVIQCLGVQNMLDWRKVWDVGIDITRALEYAGEQRIVHRNLGPANILCRKADQTYLLSDLMQAKATEGSHAFDVTAPGQIVGDLAYMSPERTKSNVGLDARSDIYELGATLYALLAGRAPFEANSQVEHIELIRNQLPPSPKEFQFAVHEPFADIVMNMLEKQPQDRYGSAKELLKELTRVGKFAGLVRE